MLLDEPASHLDLAHERLLVELLLAHADGGGAVVASLHDLDLAWDLADHCIVLDGRGGVVARTRDDVLGAVRLASAFGVAVEAIELARQRAASSSAPRREAGTPGDGVPRPRRSAAAIAVLAAVAVLGPCGAAMRSSPSTMPAAR